MALFGKKNNEDLEDDPTSLEASRGEDFSRKRFRDLNPQNKKKRKEPPKPWGKKERVIVLVVLLVTVVLSAILAFGSKDKINFHLSFPKIDFSTLNIFKEQTIIVGKK